MEKVIGLDLGTNSIGWAIRDTSNPQNQIIEKGVLTFEKGVAEDKSGEHPMVQKRTESRGKRRNYQAEKYRKWELLGLLIENKMCPLSIEELNEWKHYTKGSGRKYPQSKKFIDWLRFDFNGDGKPDFGLFDANKHESYYLFRKLIISTDEKQKKIFQSNPEIIGRVLYQLVQRRGYNNLQDIEDDEEAQKESKTIMEGGGDAGAIGVNEIKPYIEKYKTLGAALYNLQKETNARIRKRYNLRSDFEKEIEEICKVQQLEHLTDKIKHAIVWQRPLRTQKGNVGLCTYLKNKRRCPISHPFYEEYRTWIFINNLKIKPIDNSKTTTDLMPLREVLHNVVYPIFYKVGNDFKLNSINKELKKVGYQIGAKFPDDTKVISNTLLNYFKDIFGEDWKIKLDWQNSYENKIKDTKCKYSVEDLWHLHFSKGANKKDKIQPHVFLKEFAIKNLELDEDKANKFTKIRLQQGYATLSLNAIKKILPYLQQGFLYSHSVYLANIDKVMNYKNISAEDIENFSKVINEVIVEDKRERVKFEILNGLITQYFENKEIFTTNRLETIQQKIIEVYGEKTWERFGLQLQMNIENEIIKEIETFLNAPKNKPENHFLKTARLHDKIFQHLQDTYDILSENIKYLWHPSEQETYPNAPIRNNKKILGNPEPISKGFKNPMALKTMHQLKHLINYLIENDKIDENTRVVIETARELNNANERKAIEKWQRNRESENATYLKKIKEFYNDNFEQFAPNDVKNLIDKVRLWTEQDYQCIYTGKTIELTDLLNGAKYDYEHTIPASMSFDNELKNLTIADKLYNQQIKGKKIPFDCPNYDTDYTIDGITYTAILPRLDAMKKKVEELEKLYAEWKAKTSDKKDIKDNIIIRRHYIKFDLNYWRHKYKSFTQTEYKAGWRNSQLRDTQTITKYAIPYLKTIFNKVEAQKGSITSDFRKIYKIQPRFEEKERTKHSHHAIDAAVLTLIPPAAIRDKILLRYNEDNERGISYHEKPRQWQTFESHYILDIENEVLNNFQSKNSTLTPTSKNVRKRGEIQYVKYKDGSGKWHYKLNDKGKKIPLVAKGDSIRGQLHKESFFGVIKNEGTLNLVERYPISSFTSIKDCNHIVDKNIQKIVQTELEDRISNGLSFDKAKLEPISFPNNNTIIKNVRCKVAAGRGYLSAEKAISIRQHDFKSKNDYKNSVYAQNDSMELCLYYEGKMPDNKIERAFKIVSLFELSQLKLSNINELYQLQGYKSIEKKKNTIPLISIIQTGVRVLLYKESIEELKDLEKNNVSEFLKRIFIIYKFNEITPTKYIYLQNHIEARKNDILGNGDKEIDLTKYQARLYLTSDKFICAIEYKDFEFKKDGSIKWLN
ncbi:MAG: HNH endonuclease domain-containing protein [Chitinophagales bacterium]